MVKSELMRNKGFQLWRIRKETIFSLVEWVHLSCVQERLHKIPQIEVYVGMGGCKSEVYIKFPQNRVPRLIYWQNNCGQLKEHNYLTLLFIPPAAVDTRSLSTAFQKSISTKKIFKISLSFHSLIPHTQLRALSLNLF